MQLLANDTALFEGNEQECIAKLSEMVRDVIHTKDIVHPEKRTIQIIEQDSMHAIVDHSFFGKVHWHIEPIPNGGVFDTSSDTDLF